MNRLSELDQRIIKKLAAQREQAYQHYNHQAERWHEWQSRLERYTGLADHVVKNIIRPRLVTLANHFDNAELLAGDQTGRHQRICTFKPAPRYPATATPALAVSRDGSAQNVSLLYHLSILPAFFHFVGHDELMLPLEDVDDATVATWFDDKIMCFLDAYVNLETLAQYQRENETIDPVCGMRINKLYAAAQRQYHDTTYYFCVPECRALFDANPERYLSGHGQGECPPHVESDHEK